jgi:hypothetical protein
MLSYQRIDGVIWASHVKRFAAGELKLRRTNRLMVANASKLIGVRFGLRERLLPSFVAISGFAVAAALVGIYAFYAIGEALHWCHRQVGPPYFAGCIFLL